LAYFLTSFVYRWPNLALSANEFTTIESFGLPESPKFDSHRLLLILELTPLPVAFEPAVEALNLAIEALS